MEVLGWRRRWLHWRALQQQRAASQEEAPPNRSPTQGEDHQRADDGRNIESPRRGIIHTVL